MGFVRSNGPNCDVFRAMDFPEWDRLANTARSAKLRLVELKNIRPQLCSCVQRYQEKFTSGRDASGCFACPECPAWKFGRVEGLWKTEMSEVEYETFLVDNPWLWQLQLNLYNWCQAYRVCGYWDP